MLRSNLCHYSDVYILVEGTIRVEKTAPNNRNKKVIFKNYTPFTECMNEINNKEIDRAKVINVVMPMCNLIEFSGNYLKTSGSLW